MRTVLEIVFFAWILWVSASLITARLAILTLARGINRVAREVRNGVGKRR